MMKKREFTGTLLYYIDILLPPIIRNSFLFSKVFKSGNFKSDIFSQDINIIKEYYSYSIKRESDLSNKALNLIIKTISEGSYKKICDLGGGNLFLKKQIDKNFNIDTDVLDFSYSDNQYGYPEVNLEKKLDFVTTNYYDFSISTHTVEHLLNAKLFLDEMRRISKKGMLLVFPKEMPYLHTPNTHINFFPYKFEVEKLFGKINSKKTRLLDLKYDWVFIELF